MIHLKNETFNFRAYMRFSTLLVSFLLCLACGEEPAAPEQEEWIAMFNGANYKDWTPKFAGYELGVNHKNRFVYTDSLLRVRYAKTDTFNGNFGHLYYKQKFSHYKLRATYRFVGEQMTNGPGWAFRNNGLMLHCQEPATLGLDQDFPRLFEIMVLCYIVKNQQLWG